LAINAIPTVQADPSLVSFYGSATPVTRITVPTKPPLVQWQLQGQRIARERVEREQVLDAGRSVGQVVGGKRKLAPSGYASATSAADSPIDIVNASTNVTGNSGSGSAGGSVGERIAHQALDLLSTATDRPSKRVCRGTGNSAVAAASNSGLPTAIKAAPQSAPTTATAPGSTMEIISTRAREASWYNAPRAGRDMHEDERKFRQAKVLVLKQAGVKAITNLTRESVLISLVSQSKLLPVGARYEYASDLQICQIC
jgi:hypothetical protein